MPSSPTPSLGIEEQATGEGLNVWGVLLDRALAMFDAAVAGITTLTLTGDYTLSNTLYVANEARAAILKLNGSAPFTVTIPSVSKLYVIWNASTAVQTISTGAGNVAPVQPGEVVLIACDAANVNRVLATDFGSKRITSVGYPSNPTDAASKQYVDDSAFIANSGILPGQTGNDGKFLRTNAGVASWNFVPASSLTGLSANAASVRTGTTTATALTPGDTYNAFAVVAIAYASTVTPDFSTFLNGSIALTGALTLANPTNPKVGQTGFIELIQDATGSRVLTAVGSNWKRSGGVPLLTTTANATDVLVYQVLSPTFILYDVVRNPT
jgi:hypothetical protein